MGAVTRMRNDPAVAMAVVVLWALLALFVVYPLVMLLGRVLTDHGVFTTAGLAAVLTDKHQIRAFWNSLLLAVLVGLAGSLGLTRIISTLLFDVAATDKATFAAVATGLFAITFLAGYLPAWRATRVNPLDALHYE